MDGSPINVVEPALFPHAACAISLQALVDNLDQTVLFVVEAREPVTGRLTGLWSSAPAGLDSYDVAYRLALVELSRMLYENTGPFA